MNRKGTFLSFLALMFFVLVVFVAPAQAQNYSFSVPELRMQVFVQPDASAHIVYDITFSNNSFGQTIDIGRGCIRQCPRVVDGWGNGEQVRVTVCGDEECQ